jgi:endoglucanase
VRVPLYLAWGDVAAPAVTAAYAAFYAPRDGAPAPAWVDLKTGAVAPYAASPGMLAAATAVPGPDLPHVADAADYYSAALTLLARIGRQQGKAG